VKRSGTRGFGLIEILVALALVSVAFAVLWDQNFCVEHLHQRSTATNEATAAALILEAHLRRDLDGLCVDSEHEPVSESNGGLRLTLRCTCPSSSGGPSVKLVTYELTKEDSGYRVSRNGRRLQGVFLSAPFEHLIVKSPLSDWVVIELRTLPRRKQRDDQHHDFTLVSRLPRYLPYKENEAEETADAWVEGMSMGRLYLASTKSQANFVLWFDDAPLFVPGHKSAPAGTTASLRVDAALEKLFGKGYQTCRYPLTCDLIEDDEARRFADFDLYADASTERNSDHITVLACARRTVRGRAGLALWLEGEHKGRTHVRCSWTDRAGRHHQVNASGLGCGLYYAHIPGVPSFESLKGFELGESSNDA